MVLDLKSSMAGTDTALKIPVRGLPEKEMSEADKKRQSRRQLLYDANRTAAAYFHWLLKNTERGKRAYGYFIHRGYTDETIQKFGLGYADQYRDDLYKYLKKKNFRNNLT